MRVVSALILVGSLVGCPSPSAPTSPPPAQTPPEPAAEAPVEASQPTSPTTEAAPAPDALHGHMHEHIIQLEAARQALIKGDLPGTRAAFKWLADHEPPEGLPGAWAPHVVAVQGAARRGAGAMHLAAGADALGAAAVACGSCHEANQVRPEWPDVPLPTGEPGTAEHMRRHVWAADRMWEGLLLSSADHWARGARVLIESPLGELHPGKEVPADLAGFASRVHALGADALAEQTAAQRGALYGEFIAQCGSCHAATGDGEAR